MKHVATASVRYRRASMLAVVVASLFAIACALAPAAAANAQTRALIDDRGTTVSFDRSPRRIVSLLPSLTETVCALGECRRLVGTDRYSNHPASVLELPKVGGGIDPDIEGVVALRPDVVLLATSTRAAPRLEALGIKVLALEPRRTADFERVLRLLGMLLDAPNEAERLWQGIENGVAAAAQSLPASAKKLRVYFEVNQGPYAAGPLSFVGEIIDRLGAKNIVPAALGPYPKLNPEFVVSADPQVILVGRRNAQGLADRPGWSGIHAIRESHVCTFEPEQADVLVRAGPRMAEAARLVAGCLTRNAP